MNNENKIDVFSYLFGLLPTRIRLCRRRILGIYPSFESRQDCPRHDMRRDITAALRPIMRFQLFTAVQVLQRLHFGPRTVNQTSNITHMLITSLEYRFTNSRLFLRAMLEVGNQERHCEQKYTRCRSSFPYNRNRIS